MNRFWNLDVLYKGFSDPTYESDVNKFIAQVDKINEITKDFTLCPVNYLENYLVERAELQYLLNNLFNYTSLRLSTNVNDKEALKESSRLDIISQGLVISNVNVMKFLKDINLDSIKDMSSIVEQYYFMLSKLQNASHHMLSFKEEILESKLSLVSSSSWASLQNHLCANLMLKVEGFNELMNLSTVRNLAYHPSKDVRYNAYIAEIKGYETIKHSVAVALNNIKREVNMMNELRGYPSAIVKTLENSSMKQETLDALISAIKEELPNLRKYFKLKAKALGYKEGLPFYELFAPLGKSMKTYTLEEAKELVLDVYKSFSDKMYEMGKEAFEKQWIDVDPYPGKVGGAFCASLETINESRILTNFTGSLGDVGTLAHELGHAYHSYVCFDNPILMREYPMELAETASIFCQTLMSHKLIEKSSSKEELLTIIENSLQEDTQCIVDILSRFLFESKVLNTDISTPLNEDDMCKFMLDAQDESYGDGLDPKYKHPFMWLCKGHYYSKDLSYYNYPYAFGLLYGKGLYNLYLDDKEKFLTKYDEMLRLTTCASIEDVALSIGIDITLKDFWIDSLKLIEQDIDLFYKTLKDLGMIDE